MKIEGAYAIIETAEEAVCITPGEGEQYKPQPDGEARRRRWTENIDTDSVGSAYPCRFTRAQVLEAITPDEGDAIFMWTDDTYDLDEWIRYMAFMPKVGVGHGNQVKANALTIGKTVGELRELLEWCKPTEDE